MCAIAGIISLVHSQTQRENIISFFLDLMAHRGPNGRNIYSDRNITLGHCRLSVIDLSPASSQPFHTKRNNLLVYNGEIMNYKKLKTKYNLETQTSGDTEILALLFEKYKTKILPELNGFFAFAFYEKENNELFLVRDFPGIKPLYYFATPTFFVFSSELLPILAIKKYVKYYHQTIWLYLKMGYIPQPFTIDKDVKTLKPGEILTVQIKEPLQISSELFIKIKDFAKIENKKNTIPPPFLTKTNNNNLKNMFPNIRNTISSAINEWTTSDVPIALFLSSGLDSSIIAYHIEKKKEIEAFTITFPEDPRIDEAKKSIAFSSQLHLPHKLLKFENDNFKELLYDFFLHLTEPFGDSSAINVFLLTHLLKNKYKVVLSGDGGDELFGGYKKYIACKYLFTDHIPSSILKILISPLQNNYSIKKIIRTLQKNGISRYLELSSFVGDDIINCCTLLNSENSQPYALNMISDILSNNSLKNLNDILFADLQIVLPSDMLRKVDLFGMANSIEIRPPFLSHSIITLALNIPHTLKVKKWQTKYILRKTYNGILPHYLINQFKKGFEVPLKKILNAYLNDELYQICEIEWIRPQLITQIIKKRKYLTNKELSYFLWYLIIFKKWKENLSKTQEKWKQIGNTWL